MKALIEREKTRDGATIYRVFGRNLFTFAAPTPTNVVGESGQSIRRGELDSEYNSALAHPVGVPTYEQMRRSDSQVRKQLRGIIYPILAADWKIALPAGKEDDSRSKEAKEFIEAAVLGIGPKEGWYPAFTFRQHLREALTMLAFGFATFEKVWKGVDGKMVIDRLPLRYAQSIVRVELGPNGSLKGLWQSRNISNDDSQEPRGGQGLKGWRGNDIFLPIDRLLHYTFEQEGIEYFGVPLLRAMYKAWKFKEMSERYDIIDTQRRAAGTPKGTLGENDGTAEREKMIEIVRHLDGSNPENRWVVLKAGQEVGFVNNDAKAKDIKEAIARYNMSIADGASGRFMDGEGGSGLKAVVGKLSDQFFVTLNAIADELCETIGQQWINALLEQNYPGLEGKPYLTFSRLALDEGLALVDTLGVAKQAGLIPHWGLADENHVRTHLRLRALTEEEAEEIETKEQEKVQQQAEAAMKMQQKFGPDPGSVPARPGGGPPRASRDPRASQRGRGDRADRGRADRQKARRATQQPRQDLKALAESVGMTADQFFDRVLETPKKVTKLKELERAYGGVIQSVVNSDIRPDFMRRIRSGEITLGNVSRVKARFAGKLQDALNEINDRATEFGREQVKREIAEMNRVGLRGETPIPEARRKYLTIGTTAAKAGVGIDVGKILREEEAVLMSLVQQYAASGMSLEEIADAVAAAYADRVDGYIVDTARRSTSRAYNAGRDLEAQVSGVAERAVRSEEMDDGTCENCAEIHGLLVEVGSGDYWDFMPPNYCQGYDRCRGEYVYFPAGE